MLLFSCGVYLFSKNEALESPHFSVNWKELVGMFGEKEEAGNAELPALSSALELRI